MSAESVKRVLVVAYHFPPLAGSSGVQRTLRFVQHLPRFGWEPVVLTCDPRAYDAVSPDLLSDVPSGVVVERAFALDTSRHLAVRGRYPGFLARPDRWLTWWPFAVRAGLGLIRRHRPRAIFSTYPIATAHLIGASLARRSGLPWIADFRDPMAQEGYPPDPRTWRSFRRIEDQVFRHAPAATFTTPGAAAMYRERYPDSPTRLEVIENGYDEESFAHMHDAGTAREPLNRGVVTLLHSGIVYPSERDPTQLFAALARLKREGVDGKRLRLRFRAPVHDRLLLGLAREHAVEDMIEVMPHALYREALAEMLRADALLVLQADNCNAQIPAKLYEYLRARRPLLALTDPAGDTAQVLRASGIDALAPLDSISEIAALLRRLVNGDLDGMLPTEQAVANAARTKRAEQLARLLDRVAADAVEHPTRAAAMGAD